MYEYSKQYSSVIFDLYQDTHWKIAQRDNFLCSFNNILRITLQFKVE